VHRLGLRVSDKPRRQSIRQRLLALALLPLGVVLPLLLILTQWGSAYLDRLLVAKVGADLGIANGYYERVSAGIGTAIEGLAGSTRLAAAAADPAALPLWLDAERQRLKLDFLHLLDANDCAPGYTGKPCFAGWPVIDHARAGQAKTDNDLFTPGLLAAINPALARRAHTPLLPTQNAAPDPRLAEERGLVVHSAAPVYADKGQLLGYWPGVCCLTAISNSSIA
jgi:two-component system, NtrC family, sensor kinase